MRVPTIAWWPGSISAGSVSDELTTHMDLLLTFVGLGKGEMPDDRLVDGRDIKALLYGQPNAHSPYQAFFYYKGNDLKAVRSGDWKLHINGELYNLEQDIGERQNVAGPNPDVVAKLSNYLNQAQQDLGNPKNCSPVGKTVNPQYLVSGVD